MLIENIRHLLDIIYARLICQFFDLLSRGLDLVIIKPLDLLHFPPVLQVFIIGNLTALLSWKLRSLLKIEEKTDEFRNIFQEKRERERLLAATVDEKYARQALLRAHDEDIDEDYNAYLAEHFARYGLAYLMPIFLAMLWIGNIFSPEILSAKTGSVYLFELPDNTMGIKGISVPLVFLSGYLATLIPLFKLSRRKKN